MSEGKQACSTYLLFGPLAYVIIFLMVLVQPQRSWAVLIHVLQVSVTRCQGFLLASPPPCLLLKSWGLFLQSVLVWRAWTMLSRGSRCAVVKRLHAKLISLVLSGVWLLSQPAPYINSNRRSSWGIGDFMSPFTSYNRSIILPEQTALDNVFQHTLQSVPCGDTSLLSSCCAPTGGSILLFENGERKPRQPLFFRQIWVLVLWLFCLLCIPSEVKRLPGTENRAARNPLLCREGGGAF